MTWVYGAAAIGGFMLLCWASAWNPRGACDGPRPLDPRKRTARGPYRVLRHPMYVGQWLTLVGVGGLAAGFWNALAFGLLASLLFMDWAWRETGSPAERAEKEGASWPLG